MSNKCQTEKRKNAELRVIIDAKERAMKLQIEEYTEVKRKLDQVTFWFDQKTGIGPASLESYMKTMDRLIDEK